jgi:predicted esterase
VREHLHNCFVHGHCGQIENPDDIVSLRRRGNRIAVEGRAGTENWLHFAVPTPVMVDDQRLRPGKVFLRYRASGGGSHPPEVNALHLWDGDTRIKAVPFPTGTVDAGWTLVTEHRIDVLAVYWGLGISVGLDFPSGGQVEVETVGCDFDYANRICPQRFLVRTSRRKTLEFPYLSSHHIDRPNDSIRRILVSLHGTGGDGNLYLDNGLLAAEDAGVLDETLVIAPQFIYPKEYYRTSHFYREHLGGRWEFPANLVYWDRGRAYAAESAERDLSGGGVPDSGTVNSFAVVDALLERTSRPTLFPNLQAIVIAGQSNGGQFVNRYAAASRFEEVATARGLTMRYVVMSAGSYVHLDRLRAASGTTDTFEVPTTCPEYDNWPHGLGNVDDCPEGADCPPGYVTETGAGYMRSHYARRDVIYLQGADDIETHDDSRDCGAALQGSNTVEKGETYFNYLRYFYRRPVHERHVVTGVGHSGRDLMTSPEGLAALFDPS